VAIALAMSLPKHFPYRWQIIDFAFGVTLFMLLVNGTTMSWMITKLNLNKPSLLLEFLGKYAVVRALKNVLQRLETFQSVIPASEEQRQHTISKYQQKLKEAEMALEELRPKLGDDRYKRKKLLWLQCFSVQRKVYLDRYENGLLCRRAFQMLEWDIKTKHINVHSEKGPFTFDRHLPSDKKSSMGLFGFLRQMFPKVVFFRNIIKRNMDELAGEATAVIAASRTVLNNLDHIGEFSLAEEKDLFDCQHFYKNLEQFALVRLKMLSESYDGSTDAIRENLITQLVLDAKTDVVTELEKVGELPSEVAKELIDSFEHEHSIGANQH
jgi:hypothetical protein